MSDILTLDDALDMINRVGKLVNRSEKAENLVNQLSDSFKLSDISKRKKTKVAYFIWKNPNMVAANQTFIHSMLEIAGFENAFAHLERYPVVTDDELLQAYPDVIFLSSEPFPFKEKHFEAFLEVFKSADNYQMPLRHPIVKIVDGELFSWYGSRLLKSVDYFASLSQELLD
jgi:ABC-type Fe3+-hydroxamate transport system substrate-binding protein